MGVLCFKNVGLDDDLREIMPESCGVAAAINVPDASWTVAQMITSVEKRGERGGGIASCHNGNLYHRRRIGPFSIQFREFDSARCKKVLPGTTAIGHCRYATHGDPDFVANVQPLTVFDSKYGWLATGHNGTLVDAQVIKRNLLDSGCAFNTTTDTEIIIHLILQSGESDVERAIISALQKIPCAYSLLIMTRDKVFAIRDRFGNRPLSLAKMGGGFLSCSETVAFDQFPEAEYWRDVNPGEMVIFEKDKAAPRSVNFAEPEEFFCIFEAIYFSNPRSKINGIYHDEFRRRIGWHLGYSLSESKLGNDPLVVPILDSGKHFAEGLARYLVSNMSPGHYRYEQVYEEVLQRAHGPLGGQARSFTAVTTEERIAVVRKKLHLKKEAVKDRVVVVVDDSIVRSNTAKVVIGMFRQAGAKKVIFCVGFPPITNICPNGMDFQTVSQLVAYHKDVESVRKEIGADELHYLKPEHLADCVRETYKCGYCGGCFGGKYPVCPRLVNE